MNLLSVSAMQRRKLPLLAVKKISSEKFFCVELWFGCVQIATRQDLGLADAYVDGDFTFVNPKEGLLNFLLVSLNSLFHLSKRLFTNMHVVVKPSCNENTDFCFFCRLRLPTVVLTATLQTKLQ